MLCLLQSCKWNIEQMGMKMTSFKPCLRLGSLETDSEMETVDRRFIGKISQEIHQGRCGWKRGWPACPDPELSPCKDSTLRRPFRVRISHRGQHRASPAELLTVGQNLGGMGGTFCEAVLVSEGHSQRRPSSEPQWQIFPETGGSMVCLWRGNMGGAHIVYHQLLLHAQRSAKHSKEMLPLIAALQECAV